MFASKDVFLTPPSGSYTISRSVRLRSSASAKLSRTFSSAGNRTTWTYSAWIKRGKLGSTQGAFLNANPLGSAYCFMGFGWNTGEDGFYFYEYNGGWTYQINTTAQFRDPSAWYHFVVTFDTAQATASNRIKVYVNGVQQTSFVTANYPSQNLSGSVNQAALHWIGEDPNGSFFDGYMAEVNFIDGQALTPSSFGQNNAITGVWQPKQYAGTYGTTGFYLKFSDPTSTTTISYDYSGNGNNWTSNNISVTAGVTYDSMIDVPTVSATGSNYATFNPVQPAGSYAATFADGNLKVTSNSSGAGQTSQVTTLSFPATGNWYAEVTVEYLAASAQHLIGIVQDTYNPSSASDNPFTLTSIGYGYNNDGNKRTNSTNTSYGATWTTGNVIGINLNNGTLTFYKDGASQGSAFTGLTGNFYVAVAGYSSDRYVLNAGQQPFAYTPPTGSNALNTQNLPDSTITNGADYMAATLYTGNGSAGRVITVPDINEVGFAWVKIRSGADDHRLANIVTGGNKHLKSNATDAESSGTNIIQAFSANTFTVGSDTGVNANGSTYVAWTWAANGAAVTNTAGSITSSVSAGVSQGFSVVTWTGTGSTATIGHGLGVAPKMIIVKSRSGVQFWRVYFNGLTAGNVLYLNTTDASSAESGAFTTTAPTSSVFSVGTSAGTNGSGSTYVAYCFAEVAGYSKFGSYQGNGSSDGPMVYLGFKPRFVLIKRTDSSDDWFIIDTSRNAYNVSGSALYPNSSSSETTNGWYNLDVTSNGFKVRASNTPVNASGGTYIYAAFAENPFKNALAR